jgi:hypothetical protein
MGGRAVEGSGLEIPFTAIWIHDFSVSQWVSGRDIREHSQNNRHGMAQSSGTPRAKVAQLVRVSVLAATAQNWCR